MRLRRWAEPSQRRSRQE